MPAISIILPVYNGARYLEQALDSIRRQRCDLDDIEIIATDDNSSDNSPAILADAAATLPLTVIPGANKGNWVASTNLAMTCGKGEYICFLHQDDRFRPDKIGKLIAAAQLHSDADVFAHSVAFINHAGRRIGNWTFPAPARRLRPAEWLPPLLVQNNLAVPGVMFRRALLDTVEPLDESLRYTADWDFWLRLAACYDLVHLPGCLAEYRIHGEAQTVDFAGKQTEYTENLHIVLNRYLGTLNALDLCETSSFGAMAKLGIATNLWLASRLSGQPQPVKTIIREFRDAGFRNSLRYIHLSRVIPRTLARLRARIWQPPPPQANS